MSWGGEPKLRLQDVGQPLELGQGGDPVAARQIALDQGAVRRLAQGLQLDRPVGQVDRITVAAALQAGIGAGVEQVELQLAQALPLDGEPLVGPPGQQFGPVVAHPGQSVEVAVEDLLRQVGEEVDVDLHVRGQGDRRGIG